MSYKSAIYGLIFIFSIAISTTYGLDLDHCSNQIIDLVPIAQKFQYDIQAKNLEEIYDDLLNLHITAEHLCDDCDLMSSLQEGFERAIHSRANAKRCFSILNTMYDHINNIIDYNAEKSSMITDYVFHLNIIFKLLPPALQDCEVALPINPILEEELKMEEELDIFVLENDENKDEINEEIIEIKEESNIKAAVELKVDKKSFRH